MPRESRREMRMIESVPVGCHKESWGLIAS